MSDNTYWQDDNDRGYGEVEETNAMKILREKAEKDSALIREMSERLRKMEEKEQRSHLESTLTAKGLSPKVADLIPKDANPEEWLATYGDVFSSGEVTPADESSTEGELDEEEAAALAALGAAGAGVTPKAGLSATEALIASAEDEEALMKILRGA